MTISNLKCASKYEIYLQPFCARKIKLVRLIIRLEKTNNSTKQVTQENENFYYSQQ